MVEIALVDQPRVERLEGVTAVEASQVIGAQGEQSVTGPPALRGLGEGDERPGECRLFPGIAAQGEQFLALVDEQQQGASDAQVLHPGRAPAGSWRSASASAGAESALPVVSATDWASASNGVAPGVKTSGYSQLG